MSTFLRNLVPWLPIFFGLWQQRPPRKSSWRHNLSVNVFIFPYLSVLYSLHHSGSTNNSTLQIGAFLFMKTYFFWFWYGHFVLLEEANQQLATFKMTKKTYISTNAKNLFIGEESTLPIFFLFYYGLIKGVQAIFNLWGKSGNYSGLGSTMNKINYILWEPWPCWFWKCPWFYL